MTIHSQRERASIEFIRAHLLELQGMARLSRQSVLAYLIEMAAMEASELLGQNAARRAPELPPERVTETIQQKVADRS